MSESMHELKEMLCQELDTIVERGDISLSNLDMINKIVVTIEKIARIDEIEGGNSQSQRSYAVGNYDRSGYGNSREGGSYGGSYGEGNSYRRMSRYSQAGEDMGQKIEMMMNDPRTPQHEKESLRKAMQILQR